MALLLIPAYVLYGHFLGNGIYAILLCALGTIALTYFIGVKLGGRWCGCFAALFLITNYGFSQYSQKIMTDVPPRFSRRPRWPCCFRFATGNNGFDVLRSGSRHGFCVFNPL